MSGAECTAAACCEAAGREAAAGAAGAAREAADPRRAAQFSAQPAALGPELQRAQELTRYTQDFPKPGILFRDVTPVLADAAALQAVVADIVKHAPEFDVVAGVEARGFLLAGAVAVATHTGALAVRKAGKLPVPSASASYELEYGTATVEVQQDIQPGSRVLIVDDALATGGTALAAAQVITAIGGTVVGIAVLHEISGLAGRSAVAAYPLHVVFPNSDA